MFNIVVLISGNGTNLQEIIDKTTDQTDILGKNVRVGHVISNKKDAYGMIRARDAGIPVTYLPYIKKDEDRITYDLRLLATITSEQTPPDLIVLAGWMHVLSKEFLDACQIPIINLHPALPGRFPGVGAIEQAFNTYQNYLSSGSDLIPDNLLSGSGSGGDIYPVTGCMVHLVVPEIDAGHVISCNSVPIMPNDTLDTLTIRVHWTERFTLIQSIQIMVRDIRIMRDKLAKEAAKIAEEATNAAKNDAISELTQHIVNSSTEVQLLSKGKVRDIYQLGESLLAMIASDRCSSYDRHICDIPLKGRYLNQISEWWFNHTRHIVPNHLLYAHNNISIVKRCKVIPIEVVVRGYMARSKTSTSLWTNYNKCPPGRKIYCGITFPDDLETNCQLPTPVVTPTTKSTDHDIPLSGDEVVHGGYLAQKEWNYIERIALELFNYGSKVADQMGLILVDTKFEFGFDEDGIITLIDEVLTPDSSRYWVKKTYQSRLATGLDPESLDKELIRQYVATKCDPYDLKSPIPPIPTELIENVRAKYELINHFLLTKIE